jgi:tryptophan 2,3-dioxygenase
MINLVAQDKRSDLSEASIAQQFEQIYWQYGATELASGKQTLTLKQFKDKYSYQFLALATKVQQSNLWQCYKNLEKSSDNSQESQNLLKRYDVLVNINWPLAHYKSAVRYLNREPNEIKATGGTNWQKYLPPRFQKRIFYPQLWSEIDKEDWGKSWVNETLADLK